MNFDGRPFNDRSREDLIAELKALRLELKGSGTHPGHAGLFDVSPVPHLLLDEQGIIVTANAAASRILGRTQRQLNGKPFVTTVAMSESEPFWRHLERCFVERTAVRTELEFRVASEDLVVDAISTFHQRSPGDRPLCLSALMDIRDRKAAAARARRTHEHELESRARVQRVAASQLAIFEALADLPTSGLSAVLHTIVEQARHLADAECAAIGIGRGAERPYEQWEHVGLPASLAHDLVSRASVGSAGPRSFLSVPIRHRERHLGKLFLLNKHGGGEFGAEDERWMTLLAHSAAMAIEAADTSEANARQKAWLQAIVDQSPEAIVITDREGRRTLNEAARALVAPLTTPEPLTGPPLLEVRTLAGEPVPMDQLPHERALAEGHRIEGMELSVITPDGRRLSMLASAAPVLDAHGERLGAVTLWRDISSLKQLERVREEWIALVAHDLRQPLHTLFVSDELLAQSIVNKGPHEARAVERIRTAIARLSRMVEDLIDTSLLEARRMKLSLGELSIPEVVQDVQEQMGRLLDGRHVLLHMSDRVPRVRADRGRIEQVLVNLLVNAVKYGTAGTPIIIAVTTTAGLLTIAVTNEGDLPADSVTKVFSRFYRTPRAEHVDPRGSGLGLYIAKGLVEAHGGRIWAGCESGKVTFSFSLPLESER
jgi:PAS domain S-box-containing protein